MYVISQFTRVLFLLVSFYLKVESIVQHLTEKRLVTFAVPVK